MWVLIVLIVTMGTVLVLWLVSRRPRELPPVEALELRFAKGEITEAEFLRSMAILRPKQMRELAE
jgi:uncharacterized membrane protein